MVFGSVEGEGFWQMREFWIMLSFKEPDIADMMKVAGMKWLGHAIWMGVEVISVQVLFCWIMESQMSRVALSRIVGLCNRSGKSWCCELEKVNKRQKNGRELLKRRPTQGCRALKEWINEFFSVLCNFIHIKHWTFPTQSLFRHKYSPLLTCLKNVCIDVAQKVIPHSFYFSASNS